MFKDHGAYNCDKDLLKKLGLKEWNSSIRGFQNLGTISIGNINNKSERDEQTEKIVKVEVSVESYPACFFLFNISVFLPYKNETKNFKITTGSGCFCGYWKLLGPIFENISTGMLSIKLK